MIPSLEEGDMIKTIIKNQCFTPADSINRLNWLPTSRPVAKNFENFTECSWKNKESIKKKRFLIPSLDEGDTIKTSPSAPNLNMPL